MKNILFTFLLLTSVIFADNHNKLTHKMDKSHTSVNFEVTHLVISKVTGVFKEFTSEIHWNPNKLNNSFLDRLIRVVSITIAGYVSLSKKSSELSDLLVPPR